MGPEDESNVDQDQINEGKDYHKEEEATWVDAAEADRWEREQEDRWNGVGVRSFSDP